mgnify:CR=1 FL=1
MIYGDENINFDDDKLKHKTQHVDVSKEAEQVKQLNLGRIHYVVVNSILMLYDKQW